VLVVWEALALLKLWLPTCSPRRAEWLKLSGPVSPITAFLSASRSACEESPGIAISVVLGILLGVLLTWSRFLQDTLGGVILSLQSLPSICWVPLALLWFGLSETAIIFVTSWVPCWR